MTTADRIKNRRLELGLTQLQVAKRMGLTTKAAVSKVERQGDNVTLKSVEKFAKALDCSTAYLMGWDDKLEDIEEEYKNAVPEHLKRYAQFINLYAQLGEDEQDLVDNMITTLLKKQ